MYNNTFSKSPLIKNISAVNLFASLLDLPNFESCPISDNKLIDPVLQPLMNLKLPKSGSKEHSILLFLIKYNSISLAEKLKYLEYDPIINQISVINTNQLIMSTPVLSEWWNESTNTLSQNTWLPNKSLSFGNNITCLHECTSTMGVNNWFSIMSTKSTTEPKEINKPSYQTTLNTIGNINGVVKIRLYPTQHQKNILQQMFDANRYSYNKVIEVIGDKMFDFSPGVYVNTYKDARRYTTKKYMTELGIPDRIKNVNSLVLQSAYRDVNKARDSMIALSIAQKARTGKGFMLDKLKFRSKKQLYSESIEIPSIEIESIKDNNDLFVSFLPMSFRLKKEPTIKSTKRRTSEQVKIDKQNEIKQKNDQIRIRIKTQIPTLISAVRLQMVKPGIFYLCIPVKKSTEPITANKICSIDPGVRTMLTVFDPTDKQIYMIGNNVDKLVKRSKKIDILKSQLRKFKGKRNKRYRLKKEIQFIRRKLKNMTHDMRHKTSKFLADNYKTILYPTFNIKSMCNKKYRNISKATVRQMYLWSHYKFRELLKYKTSLRGGKVIDCNEEYTSKTCSCCGRLNHTLGASKKFKCPFCNYEVDRDVGAARNIYLKNYRLV
jgi:IS605 OrfB family transposase